MCVFLLSQVMRPGDYTVTFFYLSQQQATFRLSVGTFSAIINGKAQSIKFLLPAQVRSSARLVREELSGGCYMLGSGTLMASLYELPSEDKCSLLQRA